MRTHTTRTARARCLTCDWATGDGTGPTAAQREAKAHAETTGHLTRVEDVRWTYHDPTRDADE